MTALSVRVASSAKILDKEYPDWHTKVDLSTFDMLYQPGDLASQLRQKGIKLKWNSYDEEMCFACPENKSSEDDYRRLTDLWKKQILLRKKKDRRKSA